MEKRTLYREGTYKKGNLHTHTTWSDGMHTPKETAEHYRSQGYDFLALTDHWVYGIHPELNRDDFLLFPGTELDIELPGRKDHHLVGFGLPETNRIPEHYTFEEERKNGVLTTAERIIEYFGAERKCHPVRPSLLVQDRFHGYQISAGHDRHGNLQPRF